MRTLIAPLACGLVMLFAVPVFAGEPIDTCDPADDPADCECPTNWVDYGTCSLIPESDVPAYDDPSAHDLSFITTEYDSNRDVYIVHVDLTAAPTRGIIRPLSNEGHGESVDELETYVSELLGVPLDANNNLEDFEYSQDGVARRLDTEADEILPGTGTFWRDVIATLEGDVIVNDSDGPGGTDLGDVALAVGVSGGCFKHGARRATGGKVDRDYDRKTESVGSPTGPDGELEATQRTGICALTFKGNLAGTGFTTVQDAETTLKDFALTTSVEDNEIRAVATCPPPGSSDSDLCRLESFWQMKVENGTGTLRLGSVDADTASLTHHLYRKGALKSSPGTQNSGKPALHHGTIGVPVPDANSPDFDGVCADGYVKKGNNEIDIEYTKARVAGFGSKPISCP